MRLFKFSNIYCLILVCLFSFADLYGQQTETNVDLAKADAFYEQGYYGAALPLYERSYNANPADGSIALKYGICLSAAKTDLNKAITILNDAIKKKQTEAYIYLGDTYADLYRFEDAKREYAQYLKLKKKDNAAANLIAKKNEELGKLEKLVDRTENIQIIDSIIVDKKNFLSPYKLSLSGGKVTYFKNVFDANMDIESTVYSNEKGNKIYFAQPEGDLYSLHSMEKLMDGFGNEKKLSSNNFGFTQNVNYVFVMPDGVTTYFAAEDVNGIGGYDLYVTRYNMNTDTYLTPERLNMPFNSPFNDYMMVVDEEKGVGWFATDRYMSEEKVCIYTFIPNNEVEIIESEDKSYLTGRARISSIKDTWKAGVNYSQQIALARKEVVQKTEVKHDFEFVINDKYTYYTYNDFKNSGAKNIYTKARESANALKKTEDNLSRLRDSYKEASSGDRSRLSNDILRLEQEQERLFKEVQDLEINARNEEIKYLK